MPTAKTIVCLLLTAAVMATPLACSKSEPKSKGHPKGHRGCPAGSHRSAPLASSGSGKVRVLIDTSMGTIVADLDEEKAPVSVANFLRYADEGFYDGTIFHRVIPGFMIQGGGFGPDMTRKATHAPISNEAANGLKNDRGTLAMARTSEVNSATSQFFINVVDNDGLNYRGQGPNDFGYAVFGKVVEGMDVADKIVAVETATVGPMQNVPVESVEIRSVRRAQPSPAATAPAETDGGGT